VVPHEPSTVEFMRTPIHKESELMRLSSSSSSHPHSSLTPNPPPPHIHFSRSQFPPQHPSYFGGGGGWVGSEEGQKVGRSRGWSIPVPPPASPQPTPPPPPLSISMTTVRGHKRLRAYRSLSQPYTMYICMYTSRVCVCVRARARACTHTHTHTHPHRSRVVADAVSPLHLKGGLGRRGWRGTPAQIHPLQLPGHLSFYKRLAAVSSPSHGRKPQTS
jgi:hypothetical protein